MKNLDNQGKEIISFRNAVIVGVFIVIFMVLSLYLESGIIKDFLIDVITPIVGFFSVLSATEYVPQRICRWLVG